jgi:hypothetical protein
MTIAIIRVSMSRHAFRLIRHSVILMSTIPYGGYQEIKICLN